MRLSPFENFVWGVGTALKILLCFFVFYRRLYRHLPVFSAYAALLVLEWAAVWGAYHGWGYLSRPAWYTYWCAAGIVLMARGLVVAELSWTSLKSYPAIWPFVYRLLVAIAMAVLGYAGVSAWQNASHLAAFVLATERSLELSVCVLMVALLAFGVRYKVALGPVEQNLALGLGLYCVFQVANDSFLERWMSGHFDWWNSTRIIAFDVTLVIWTLPLLRPLPGREPAPVLIRERIAGRLLKKMLEQMREASEELKRIGKSVWK